MKHVLPATEITAAKTFSRLHLRPHSLAPALALFLVLSLAGCRFDVPDPAEQGELVRGGYVAGNSAPWMSPNVSGGSARSSFGVVPDSFNNSIGSSGPSIRAYVDEEEVRRESREAATEAEAKVPAPEADEGPIGRIEKICPGLESQVSEAITTTDLPERIGKYEALSRQCGKSVDIWFWLGRDYYKAGRVVEAGRALDQALIIEPSNREAADLLREVRKPLNR